MAYMGNWGEAPIGPRLKMQAANFFFYLIGVGIRSFLLGIAMIGVFLIPHSLWQGVICLGIGLSLMWLDAQQATDPKDWLKAKNHVLE